MAANGKRNLIAVVDIGSWKISALIAVVNDAVVGLLAGAAADLGVGDGVPRRCRLVRLVDERDAVGVDGAGPAQEVRDRQGNLHGANPRQRTSPALRGVDAGSSG